MIGANMIKETGMNRRDGHGEEGADKPLFERSGGMYTVDAVKGYRKLASRMFANDVGRAFEELVSNAVDAYPPDLDREKVRVELAFGEKCASVTDWGEGMSLERVRCLLTLGGTDKGFSGDRIGRFGVGFFSLFDPDLQTAKVRVTTRCEDRQAEITFTVGDPAVPPAIEARALDEPLPYATRIEVTFRSARSPDVCKRWIEGKAGFYPYDITINNRKPLSIWKRGKHTRLFDTGYIKGRIYSAVKTEVRILCRYNYLRTLIPDQIADECESEGGIDFLEMPKLPELCVDLNCNHLNVILSRNSFPWDAAACRMAKELSSLLRGCLLRRLSEENPRLQVRHSLVYANQYVFRRRLGRLARDIRGGRYVSDAASVECRLFEERLFTLEGKRGLFSLMDMCKLKTSGLPLFYCAEMHSVNWLNRRYRHDFVLVLSKYRPQGMPSDYVAKVFQAVFGGFQVDLDLIGRNPEWIRKLVEDGIIKAEDLASDLRLNSRPPSDPEEQRLLEELSAWLRRESVARVLRSNFQFRVQDVDLGLFEAKGRDANVLAAFFDHEDKLLVRPPKEIDAEARLKIGLNAGNPLFQSLKWSRESNRAYYMLGLIVHELTMTQRLVPHSCKFYYVKHNVETELMVALQAELMGEAAS